jgi:ribosome-associated heat shock protein Hsp15
VTESAASVRLDKWLWAARFFKTRSLATEAVAAGHVQAGGQRAKPGRPVRIGDQLRVVKAGLIWEVEVVALAQRRGPASVAQGLYAETAQSAARRLAEIEARRSSADPLLVGHAAADAGPRPTKRDRRRMERWRDPDRN